MLCKPSRRIHKHSSSLMCLAGPSFKMASVPARDQLGRGIAQKATMSLKRKAAARAGTPLATSLLTGKQRVPGTPLPLSSAGKRLASNLRGTTPASDVQLRASYKSTPQGTPCLLLIDCSFLIVVVFHISCSDSSCCCPAQCMQTPLFAHDREDNSSKQGSKCLLVCYHQ